MLSKRDLYPVTSGAGRGIDESYILCQLLLYCDSKNDLFEISRILEVPIDVLHRLANKLEKKGIIERLF
jgi:aminopeptidase-like protein